MTTADNLDTSRRRRIDWCPPDVDTERACAARMYDYSLGGAHNFAVDRKAANEVLAVLPEATAFARANRAFLRRVVHYGIRHGIRQFLDLGCGLPTADNVHEMAHALAPDARVVYVDKDPVAVTHSRTILTDNPYATCVEEDITAPDRVLQHEQTQRLLDFSQPIMVLMVGLLHFVPDEKNPAGIVRAYFDALVPGSYLALTHATADDHPERMAKVVEIYRHTQNPVFPRARAEITAMVTGVGLVRPGAVYTPQWRPQHPADVGDPAQSLAIAAVAHRPHTGRPARRRGRVPRGAAHWAASG